MFYTVRQVAEELGVTRQRVHQVLKLLNMRPARMGGTGPMYLTEPERQAVVTRTKGQPGRPPHTDPP